MTILDVPVEFEVEAVSVGLVWETRAVEDVPLVIEVEAMVPSPVLFPVWSWVDRGVYITEE